MNSMTAIGPTAHLHADQPNDFVVTCRADGECLIIREDGDAEWVGEMSLREVAAGAAQTLVKWLWALTTPDAARAVALTRLYDRMDDESRATSLQGVEGAGEILACWPVDDTERAMSLLYLFDVMEPDTRRKALETLILVGLDVSRKWRLK